MRRVIVVLLTLSIGRTAAAGPAWGAEDNGLRVGLEVSVERGEIVVSMQNTRPEREMYLPLGGIVGVGRAEFVHLDLVFADGKRRQLQYTGGSGVAPGRIEPFIVPMMAGSLYTVRLPLRYWRLGRELGRIEQDLARGAGLQAYVSVAGSPQWKYIQCYGLQMFWSGRAGSAVVRP